MKFSYNWLKELAGFKESPEQLAELLTLRVFEVESVEKKGNDWALDIKLPPNRYADASGHEGMAGEIAILKNYKSQIPNYAQNTKHKTQNSKLLEVKLENSNDCPRYTARVMTNIKVGESPKWVRERLETCGLQPINNLVDAANYVMLETGQPLHVFDYEKLAGKKITVRRAKKGEKLHALDEKIYELSPDILVIAGEKGPIAIAGMKGGKESGVSGDTRMIALEAANFSPTAIRRGSQELKLKTDASIRFEHGLDPNQTETAINRLALLIKESSGGDMAEEKDKYPKTLKPHRVLFHPEYARRLLGATLTQAQFEKLLLRLGFPFQKRKGGLLIEIPSNRQDLAIEEDLIEEVGRLYGYENIPAAMPETALIPPRTNDELFWENRIKEILAASGFTESLLYEFAGDKELDLFFARRDNVRELENPTSPETRYLAPRILFKYLVSAAENLRNVERVKIFGIGKSFTKNREAAEKKDLIITTAEKGSSGEEQFYQLKGVLDQLFESLGVNDLWYDDVINRQLTTNNPQFFHTYRVAEIKIGDEMIGRVGEIHPEVLKNIKSKARIAAAEIDFEKLWKNARAESEYTPVGKYPAAVRDIAVVVPEDTRTIEVQNIIENLGGDILVDTDLFDYYQGSRMREQEEKSLAFHLIYQSPERTLTDKEMNDSIEKIIKALEEKGWEVRK